MRLLRGAVISGQVALCCGLVACAVPSSFNRELDAALQKEQEAAERAAATSAPAEPVRHSEHPFIDPRPQRATPAWTHRYIREFSATARHAPELLQLAAAAMGVPIHLDVEEVSVPLPFDFDGGSAAELVAAVADHLGLFGRIQERAVVFSDRQVRVFHLMTFADESQLLPLAAGGATAPSLSAQAGLAPASAAGGQQQYPARWRNLEQQVQLLAGKDAEVLLSPAQGILTLRARPPAVQAVANYLAEWNHSLGRQVELDVKLVQISLSNESGIGLDWSLIKDGLSNTFSLSGVGAPTVTSSGLFVAAERQQDEEVVSALFRAFASQGQVRVLTNPRGVALNGRPIDIALVTQTAYLARTSPGISGVSGGVGEAGLEPDVVESGFVLRVLPRIHGQEVMLHLDVRISTLTDLTEVSSGSQSIQVPTLAESRFSHWARVASGDTLVLGGVRELHSRQEFSLSPDSTTRRARSEQVLLITPRLL